MRENNKGVTLIALIVTIVVLIILATISVNLLMNGNIIGRAEQSKDIQAKATELERLELVKGDVAIDNKGKVTVDDYINEAIKQGITEEDEVEDNGDGSKNIITDNGWNVNIAPDPDNENNIIITIEGKGNGLPPRITKLTVTEKDDTTATVTIEVKRAEGATYKYYCKAEGEEYGEPFYTGTDLSKDKTELELEDKEYVIKVEAINQYGTSYKEKRIGDIETIASIPRLTDGMTPVKWNGSQWEKTTENDPEWYSYTKVDKKWANVVLGEAKWVGEGEKILDESQPYSQLVWIPRYAYKITSMYHYDVINQKEAGKIKLKFIDSANIDSNGEKYSEDYPTVIDSGAAIGRMDDYVVHPAFNFGKDKLTGIWVGKYECSFQGTGKTELSGRSDDPNKIIMIKSGVSSWRGMTINNAFEISRKMNNNSIYGLSNNDNQVDPHLMKNNEWGAVAYLSKSRYGKYDTEISRNGDGNYISGSRGIISTTTGNEYGVYDMNGGAAEFVAAYVNNGHGNIGKYGASLKNVVELGNESQKRYVNVYYSTSSSGENTSVADYEYANPNNAMEGYKQYGDAIWETSKGSNNYHSWYACRSLYPHSSVPFFVRGGSSADNTVSYGVFSFDYTAGAYNGNGTYYIGFRISMSVL